MSPRTPTQSPPAPLLLRVLSVPAVALLLTGGGWVAGGLITNDFALSMLLTTAWIGLVGLACLALVARRRELWPALATFAVLATAAGAYLGSETLLDDRVDEDVVVADAPARAAPPAGDRPARERRAAPANVLLARGEFGSLAHGTSGVAQAIEVRGRRRVLTLTEFETDNGPDLRVLLTARDAGQGSAGEGAIDLGALKGNEGDQQYEIPREADLDRLTHVLIWCRAFSVGFGVAELRGS